jgi:hypothetical protein
MAGGHDQAVWQPVAASRGGVAGTAPDRGGLAGRRGLGGPGVFADGLAKVGEVIRRAEGTLLTLDARPQAAADEELLLAEFNAARAEEWATFASECDKFEVEIAKERRIGKLTVAELDEEGHSLDRLRRWWRDLKARDIFAVPEGVDAEERLKSCTQTLHAYADVVYRAVHAPLGTENPNA